MKDRCGNLGGKMSGPLVSIVVPVYNVESYIEECLQEALQKPSLILRPENSCLLHKINCCANDCSGYF